MHRRAPCAPLGQLMLPCSTDEGDCREGSQDSFTSVGRICTLIRLHPQQHGSSPIRPLVRLGWARLEMTLRELL